MAMSSSATELVVLGELAITETPRFAKTGVPTPYFWKRSGDRHARFYQSHSTYDKIDPIGNYEML